VLRWSSKLAAARSIRCPGEAGETQRRCSAASWNGSERRRSGVSGEEDSCRTRRPCSRTSDGGMVRQLVVALAPTRR
jgi:hypothetical protein